MGQYHAGILPQPVNAPRSGTGVRGYFHIQLSWIGGEPAASGSPPRKVPS